MFMLEEKTKNEIIKKIRGMGVIRLFMGEKPIISTSEFRFIIGCYGIKRQNWFDVLKELEEDRVIKFRKKYIYVFLKPEAIERIKQERDYV